MALEFTDDYLPGVTDREEEIFHVADVFRITVEIKYYLVGVAGAR